MDKSAVLIIVLAFFIINFIFSYKTKINIINNIRDTWGKYPRPTKKKYSEKYLKQAFNSFLSFHKKDNIIDDISWNDLDMIEIFNNMNIANSSIGAEALYRRLRITDAEQADQDYIEKLVDFFESHPKERESIQYIFSKIEKLEDNHVLEFIQSKKEAKLYNIGIHILFGLIPLICAVIIVLQFGFELLYFLGVYPLYIFLGLVLYNITFNQKMKKEIESQYKMANYLTSCIYHGKRILRYDLPIEKELEEAFRPVKSLGHYSFLGFSEAQSSVAFVVYILNIIFRISFITFARTIQIIDKKKMEILKLWTLLGDVEAAITILNYKLASNYVCKPEFIADHNIIAKELYHPLLKRPVSNDVNWTTSTLVTGSNASGKSTYVKSVAINAILAQTIYMCHAREWAMKKGNILTSMAIKDDVIHGDSYFIAEIKSLKRLIDNMKNRKNDYYFIDEILKGTNTIERIAASSSIISHLIKNHQLAFIASHDIELTKIFEDEVKNIHFRESIDQKEGITFDYKLHQGPSTTKNAIALLSHMDFPKDVIEEANTRVSRFESENSWT